MDLRGRGPPLSHAGFSSGQTSRLRKRSMSRSSRTANKTDKDRDADRPTRTSKDGAQPQHQQQQQQQQQQQPMLLRRIRHAVNRVVNTNEGPPEKTDSGAAAPQNPPGPKDTRDTRDAKETTAISKTAASGENTGSAAATAGTTSIAGRSVDSSPAAAGDSTAQAEPPPAEKQQAPQTQARHPTAQPPPGSTPPGPERPADAPGAPPSAASPDVPRGLLSSIRKLRHTDGKHPTKRASQESPRTPRPADEPPPAAAAAAAAAAASSSSSKAPPPPTFPRHPPPLISPPPPPPPPDPTSGLAPPPCSSPRSPSSSSASASSEAAAAAAATVHALSAQLAAAHQQITAQAAVLREKEAALQDRQALVERLRVRIQEQVPLTLLDANGVVPSLLMSSSSASPLSPLLAPLPPLPPPSGLLGIQIPDGPVRVRWKTLRWQIRQCVEAQLAATPATPTTATTTTGSLPPPSLGPFLRRLTPDYEAFLQSHLGTVYLVEAAVWAVLADSVFASDRNASRMCWAAHWSNTLSKLHDNLLYDRPDDPVFHHWRAHTAALVLDQLQADGEQAYHALVAPYADAVVRQLEAEVGTLLGEGGRGTSDGVGINTAGIPGITISGVSGVAGVAGRNYDTDGPLTLRQQLLHIVAEAIALDADLCQQRAYFYLAYPAAPSGSRYGMPFDPNEMEDIDAGGGGGSGSGSLGAPGRPDVTLVVQPALFRAGTSRGTGYEQAVPLEPSMVCRSVPSSSRMRRLWSGLTGH